MKEIKNQKSQMKGPVRRYDLAELVTHPIVEQLASMERRLRAEMRVVGESVEILARQKARELNPESEGRADDFDANR